MTSHDVLVPWCSIVSASVSVEALLTLICSRALAVLEEFQPLPLTNFVWSLAGAEGCLCAIMCNGMPLLVATNMACWYRKACSQAAFRPRAQSP